MEQHVQISPECHHVVGWGTVCPQRHQITWDEWSESSSSLPIHGCLETHIRQPCLAGLASASVLDRVDRFLRKSMKAGFYPSNSPLFMELCEACEDNLFRSILDNNNHPLHHLLPPKMPKFRNSRRRTHPYQLSNKGDSLHRNNFMIRMLYNNIH